MIKEYILVGICAIYVFCTTFQRLWLKTLEMLYLFVYNIQLRLNNILYIQYCNYSMYNTANIISRKLKEAKYGIKILTF